MATTVPLDFDDVLKGMFSTPPTDDTTTSTTTLEDEGPKCPRCLVPLEYAERDMANGEVWSFFRCPKENGVHCYVACGTKVECKFHTYLSQVDSTLNPAYLSHTSSQIPFENMEWCSQSLILCMSKSENNPDRLYFKCRTGGCDFFQWGDQKPRGKAWKWLLLRIHPSQVPEARRKPSPLLTPAEFNRKRPFEAVPRDADVQLQAYIGRIKNKIGKIVTEGTKDST